MARRLTPQPRPRTIAESAKAGPWTDGGATARDTLVDRDEREPEGPTVARATPLAPWTDVPVTEPSVGQAILARGPLGRSPFVHLLGWAATKRATCAVVLETERDSWELSLAGGCVQHVQTATRDTKLGEHVARLCGLRAEQLDRASARARANGLLIGEYLLASGLVGAPALEIAVQQQIDHRLAELANLPATASYTVFATAKRAWTGAPADPVPGILATVRAWTDEERISISLRLLGGRLLHLTGDFAGRLLALTTVEREAVEALRRAPATADAILSAAGGARSSVGRLLYALLVGGVLRAESQPQIRAASVTDAPTRAAEEHRRALAALEEGNYPSSARHAATAARLAPQVVQYEVVRAWTAALAGDRADNTRAIEDLSRVLAKRPELTRARLFRAKLLVRDGRIAAAIVDLRALLRLDPGHDGAREALRDLEASVAARE